MSRTSARTLAFKLNYLYLNNCIFDIDLSLDSLCDDGYEINDEERQFAINIMSLTQNHIQDIKQKIASHLKGTTMSQVYSIDYAIIATAIAEIDYVGTDKALVVSQAVSLAKKFSTDNSYAFINGLLSTIYQGDNNA